MTTLEQICIPGDIVRGLAVLYRDKNTIAKSAPALTREWLDISDVRQIRMDFAGLSLITPAVEVHPHFSGLYEKHAPLSFVEVVYKDGGFESYRAFSVCDDSKNLPTFRYEFELLSEDEWEEY
jgi:hypothetical protein